MQSGWDRMTSELEERYTVGGCAKYGTAMPPLELCQREEKEVAAGATAAKLSASFPSLFLCKAPLAKFCV